MYKSDLDGKADKVFHSHKKQSNQSLRQIVTVTECLVSHRQCTTKYIDAINGNCLIKCSCVCHSQSDQDYQNYEKDSVVVDLNQRKGGVH